MARAATLESIATPSRDDFAAMLEASFEERAPAEGSVVRGIIVAIENDFAVIDGRDIGTVVCPDAAAKLFVDAAVETRARRRWLELKAAGASAAEDSVLADIQSRDKRDRERAASPLKPAADAALLDTTLLDIDAAFARALALVKPKVEEALKARPRG